MENIKTIYLSIRGGLGNQLYQFAFAYYIYKNFKYNRIVIDDSSLNKYKEKRDLLLFSIFNNKISDFCEFDSIILTKLRIAKIVPLYYKNSIRLGLVSDNNSKCIFHSVKLPNPLILDGYFETIQNKISYKELLKDIINDDIYIPISKNTVAINIRGGLYKLSSKKYNISKEYYKRVINLLLDKNKSLEFHLITDDIEYAKNLLPNINVELHEPNPIENFRFVLSSPYKILSFSTFSIWCGLLSKDDDIVFYHPEIMERKWK